MSVRLIMGGARSGKSSYAEQLALELLAERKQENPQTQLHYIATAEAFDTEMKARIALHQERRDGQWMNHEVPVELSGALGSFTENDIVLVDCLTVWLNNVIHYLGEGAETNLIQSKLKELTDSLAETKGMIICVSTEVGLGIVPMNALTRLYVDHAGWMNQGVAKVAEQVDLVVAGLPMKLKGSGC